MEKECKIEEYHCASNTSQPVRIFSYKNDKSQPTTIGGMKKNYNPDIDRKHSGRIQDTIKYLNTPQPSEANSNTNETIKSISLFGTKKKIPQVRDTNDLIGVKSKAHNSGTSMGLLKLVKVGSMIEQENPKELTTEELKEKLADSLSPSPFRNEDPSKREAKLEQLVSSVPCTTKTLLFSEFYGSEFTGEGGYSAWKIALKDHIVHTFESIALIKKLKPVPNHIIEKKKLPIKALDVSISLYNFRAENCYF